MAEQPGDRAAKLRELLRIQRQLLTQFLHITREQEQIIANDDVESLLKTLEQRQQLIGQLDELLAKLNPLWQEYAASLGQDPALNALQEEVGRILRETTEIDAKNQATIRERMDFFRAEMKRISATRRGAETYIKGAEIFSAEYVDERH